MPLPNLPANLDTAIEEAFETVGITNKQERASKALDRCGASVEELAQHLANIILTSKDSVRRAAIIDALGLHGISTKKEEQVVQVPQIVFQVNGENINLNQLFAPQRNL